MFQKLIMNTITETTLRVDGQLKNGTKQKIMKSSIAFKRSSDRWNSGASGFL